MKREKPSNGYTRPYCPIIDELCNRLCVFLRSKRTSTGIMEECIIERAVEMIVAKSYEYY